MTHSDDEDNIINWFRAASPYINDHRGKTLVMAIPGSLLQSELLPTLTHDITLLNHLGLKLVICFGVRAQMNDVAANSAMQSPIVAGRRVTNSDTLKTMITTSGALRHDLEARFSMGLPNTPMSGAKLAVSSGNYVTAQPFGVHDGVDFQHTGSVREIHVDAINAALNAGHIVILPPLGYSLTGEVFNVAATDVATECAIALGADKLAFFVDQLPRDKQGQIVRQASAERVVNQLSELSDDPKTDDDLEQPKLSHILDNAVRASRSDVERIHLLHSSNSNALLRELYTRDGSGTLITAKKWEHIRPASIADVGGIIELITPLQVSGTLVSRSREELELDIDHFVVSERDGMVVATAAMYVEPDSSTAEIACLVTHPSYRGAGRADHLLTHLEQRAHQAGCNRTRILSTHTSHWFIARGYQETSLDELPPRRRASYNRQRNSKIFSKLL